MAGNTIAKLATVLLLEDGHFRNGMRRSGESLERFERRAEQASQRAAKWSSKFVITAAVVGAATAIRQITNLADKFHDVSVTSMREYVDAFERVNGVKPDFKIGDLETSEEAWAKLNTRIGQTADAFGVGSGARANWMTNLLDLVTPHQAKFAMMSQRQDIINRQKETQELNRQAAERERAFEKEVSDIQRDFFQAMDRMKSRAESLSAAVRTPVEIMRDSFRELDQLKSAGFIGPDVFSRGLSKAAKDFQDASAKLMEMKGGLSPSAALERGTMAEYSARVRGQLEAKRIEDAIKAQTKVNTQIRDEVKNLRNAQPIKLGVADL